MFPGSGAEKDKTWAELSVELGNTLEVWRCNPMARRVVGTTTAYVVGTDMSATSDNEALSMFIDKVWNDPKNHMALRLEDWCERVCPCRTCRRGATSRVVIGRPKAAGATLGGTGTAETRKPELGPKDRPQHKDQGSKRRSLSSDFRATSSGPYWQKSTWNGPVKMRERPVSVSSADIKRRISMTMKRVSLSSRLSLS